MTVSAPPPPGVMVPQSWRVTSRTQENADTVTLTFAAVEREVADIAPEIAPGQFMMVYAFGVGEVPISVSGVSGDGEVMLTVRAVGAVSAAICATGEGGVVGLRGPLGTAWPIAGTAGGDIIVVAGGIGLAPLRMLIRQVIGQRDDYAGVTLLYGARTPQDLLYRSELERWHATIEVAVTVDHASPGWHGRVGVVPKLIGAARVRAETAHAFICGPEVMMDFSVQALMQRGVRSERMYLSLERHMDCGVGLCGHCQLGPTLICRDGAVYRHSEIAPWLAVREL